MKGEKMHRLNLILFFFFQRGSCSAWAGLAIVLCVLGVAFPEIRMAIVVQVRSQEFQIPSELDTLLCRLLDLLSYAGRKGGLRYVGVWVDVVLFGCDIRIVSFFSKCSVWVLVPQKNT